MRSLHHHAVPYLHSKTSHNCLRFIRCANKFSNWRFISVQLRMIGSQTHTNLCYEVPQPTPQRSLPRHHGRSVPSSSSSWVYSLIAFAHHFNSKCFMLNSWVQGICILGWGHCSLLGLAMRPRVSCTLASSSTPSYAPVTLNRLAGRGSSSCKFFSCEIWNDPILKSKYPAPTNLAHPLFTSTHVQRLDKVKAKLQCAFSLTPSSPAVRVFTWLIRGLLSA